MKILNFDFLKAWNISLLLIIILIAFVVGGASREALNWHMVLYAFGWFSAALIILFKFETLIKTTPRLPIILLIVLFLWCFVTLLPFPASWFSEKSFYSSLIVERDILKVDDNSVTISLNPLGTIRSLFSFGPGLYVMLCISLMDYKQRQLILSVILLLGLISVLLGLSQILAGKDSFLYYWDFTNRGFAVGIFANTNHQTSFAALLIPIVCSLGLVHRNKFYNGDQGIGYVTLFFITCVLIIVGVVTGGSTAGYGLAIFAFISSVLLSRRKRKQSFLKNLIFTTACFILISLVVKFAYNNPRLYGLGTFSYGGGEESRESINSKGLRIVEENFTSGTGFGSFTEIYPFHENMQLVTNRFVNHAHNDWLEWVIELGLPGVVLLIVFGVWLILNYLKLFLTKQKNSKKLIPKAAAISAFVLILHSLVDYPLRTPFLNILFWLFITISVTIPNASDTKLTVSRV